MSSTEIMSRRTLSPFPKPVADVLLEAVNQHGVDYKFLDSTHVRLLSGDRSVYPAKIAASRDAKDTLRRLLKWLETNIPSWAERDEVSPESLENLAAVLGNGEHEAPAGSTGAASEPVDPEPTEDSTAAESGAEGGAEGGAESEPEWVPWEPHGRATGFETDGMSYRCTEPGCGFVSGNGRGLHLHTRGKHSADAEEMKQKAAETRKVRAEQRKQHLRAAAHLLAEYHGVEVGGTEQDAKNLERYRRRVERLEAQVEKLKAERDDALARVELMKEVLKS